MHLIQLQEINQLARIKIKMTVSIWLVPQKDQEIQLQNTINYLSKRYHAFSFVPHITAYRLDNVRSLDSIINLTGEIAQQSRAVSLDLENIFYSNIFTKTLYAQYKISPALQKLYNKFKEELYKTSPHEINPHLSLIYKNNMADKDKIKEMQDITVPEKLILDRLMVVTRNGSIKSEKDVLDWKVVREFYPGRK